ncbi:hypothetical protein ACH54_20110 [Salmonella enterica subsp. enterica serovar Infantis]|nr:hypothetical protein ACH54_20110 [Salmonella enterica subsp. enterica serovar Infantis]
MLDHQLRRHFNQLGIRANHLRLAGNADHADKLFMKRDGKINAGSHAFKLIGGSGINFYNTVFLQRQNGSFMTLAKPRRFARRDNDAMFIHDVYRVRNNFHGSLYNLPRGIPFQVMFSQHTHSLFRYRFTLKKQSRINDVTY